MESILPAGTIFKSSAENKKGADGALLKCVSLA